MCQMCKILIVDDDPDFVEVTRSVLEQEGYQTRSAIDSQQALALMRQELPDIILLDIIMRTALDGLQVVREVQTNPAMRPACVIMITSILDTRYADDFPTDEYLGFDSWMLKPVQPKALLNELNRFCKHKAASATSAC